MRSGYWCFLFAGMIVATLSASVVEADSLFTIAHTDEETDKNWNCAAVPNFELICRMAQKAVKSSTRQAMRLNYFDRSNEVNSNDIINITTSESANHIEFDFQGNKTSAQNLADFIVIADGIFPKHVTSITVKNAWLTGWFRIEKVAFGRALTLQNICLTDNEGSCQELYEPSCTPNHTANIFLDGVTLERPLHIKNSSSCGGVMIISSKLKHGILVYNDSAEQLKPATAEPAFAGRLTVAKSNIEHELYLYPVSFNKIDIRNSRVEAIQLRDSEIESELLIGNSNSSSMRFIGGSIRSMTIESSIFDGEVLLPALANSPEYMYFSNNTIKESLSIGISSQERDNFTLIFHHNHVVGSSDIIADERMKGDIDLLGSKFDSELLISHARQCSLDERDPLVSSSPETTPVVLEQNLCAMLPQNIDENSRLHINFTGAEVDALIWNLPLERPGAYTWSGAGFRYDYWDPRRREGARPYKTSGKADAGDSVGKWSYQFEGSVSDKIDAFTYAAKYLWEHGYTSDSTDLRRRALRENLFYAIDNAENFLSWFGNWSLYLILWPVGWGANPEWAFLWILLGTIISWAIYSAHSWRYSNDWRNLPLGQQWQVAFSHAPSTLIQGLQGDAHEHGLEEAQNTYQPRKVADHGHAAPDGHSYFRVWLQPTEDEKTGEYGPPSYSLVPGFNQYNSTFPPRHFNLFAYSLDAMLPLINLHQFERYYPYHPFQHGKWQYVRWFSIAQHGLGWILSTIFVAAIIVR